MKILSSHKYMEELTQKESLFLRKDYISPKSTVWLDRDNGKMVIATKITAISIHWHTLVNSRRTIPDLPDRRQICRIKPQFTADLVVPGRFDGLWENYSMSLKFERLWEIATRFGRHVNLFLDTCVSYAFLSHFFVDFVVIGAIMILVTYFIAHHWESLYCTSLGKSFRFGGPPQLEENGDFSLIFVFESPRAKNYSRSPHKYLDIW